jgi:hypothetical protein
MQKVTAYLLERREGMEWPAARSSEAELLRAEVTKWLRRKGGAECGSSGSYQPEDGSVGTFAIEQAVDGERDWWMLRLTEETSEGRRFSVDLFITVLADRVVVYATLETGWTTAHIMPASVDPRCPRIIRNLLGIPGHWYHGSSTLRQRVFVHGFDDGEGLASEIKHPGRTVPIVVVSTRNHSPCLPDIDEKLAHDLAGLANVVVLDDDAAWALTDILGEDLRCYWGAIRLFWPYTSVHADRFFHPIWTANRLLSSGQDALDVRDRFRRQLRALVFRASALSVTRPREIDDIRDAADQRTILSLRQRATSLEEYVQLADAYAKDNDQLRSERAALRDQLQDLEAQVAKLDADRQALLAHLQAAKVAPAQPETDTAGDVAPTADDGDLRSTPPEAGETRFYKKVHSRAAYDVMARVADCGCNNWQGAHAADKAKKGISRLEGDRGDWKSIQHCASCTGGGMWRVRW